MGQARRAGGVVARLALVAVALMPVGCTQLEVERMLPDGSRQRYRYVAFKPSIELRPDAFRIMPWGTTDEGYPVDLLVPKDGQGRTLYRVSPPGSDPMYFEGVRREKPRPLHELLEFRRPIDSEGSQSPRSASVRCLRLRADLETDTALLETSADGVTWQPLMAGPVPVVALGAAERGMRRIEFENAFGPWQVSADSRFPLVTVRFDDEPVAVRPIG